MHSVTHLHVTDGDTVVSTITNNFIFDFLPTLHRLLDQDLGRGGESLVTQGDELLFVLRETGTKTTESVGCSNDDGETNVVGGNDGFIDACRGGRLGALLANLLHGTSEHFSVFSGDDGVNRSTQDSNAELAEFILELDTDVQGSLSTESDVDTVRLLVLDDLGNEFGSDGQEVDLVGQTRRCLDGGDVGVDQDGVDTFFLQGLDSL